MEIRKVLYPFDNSIIDGGENWYSFGNGVKLSAEEIEEMVNSCIMSVVQQIKDKIESPYAYSATGNSFVFAFYCEDNPNDDRENYITVIVAKNYEEGTFYINDLKDYRPSMYDLQEFIDCLTEEQKEDLRKALEN